MLDLSVINKRYFEITLHNSGDGSIVKLEIEPPKVKTLKKLLEVTKLPEEKMVDGLVEGVLLILNKNRSGTAISKDLVEEMELNQMMVLVQTFMNWLNETQNSKN